MYLKFVEGVGKKRGQLTKNMLLPFWFNKYLCNIIPPYVLYSYFLPFEAQAYINNSRSCVITLRWPITVRNETFVQSFWLTIVVNSILHSSTKKNRNWRSFYSLNVTEMSHYINDIRSKTFFRSGYQ